MSIDLSRVRQLFSQPKKLQAADFIYREIANRMLERLQLIKLDPKHALDAGCGTGADLSALQASYPNVHLVGIDASEAMLRQALQSSPCKSLLGKLFSKKTISNSSWINGDFCRVPLADQSVDLVWSNLALHWHPEPDQVLKEWRRVLNVDGLLMFSCFGPDSLKELRQAFSEDQGSHTLSFIDMHDFGDMLVHAGFATPVMDMEIITLTYSTVAQLLAEVRSLGGNPSQTRSKGLMGKTAWQTMCNKLEQLRTADGRIPLTLEIIYGHAFKPVARQNKPGVSVIQFDRLKK
jgi:malonyl-CoA O-methyltransferase